MKRTTTFILICMLVVCSFLTGFTYSDAKLAHGNQGLVATIEQIPARLASAFSATLADAGAGLSPVETYWNVSSYLNSKYYVAPSSGKMPSSNELTYAAIRGMLGALGDRYTRFLDPTEFKEERQEFRGDFQGIGAELDKTNGEVVIKRPIAKSPAIRAGLKAGDIILRVNDHIIRGMDIEDVVKQIRGPRGTKVKLTIQRKDVPHPFDVEITRDVIESPNVEWKMEDKADKIGYISFRQLFGEKSDEQIGAALKDLESQGMKGLIFDLRGNGGGLLDAAVDIGSRFIKSGNIVIIKQGDGTEYRHVEPSKYDPKLAGMPMVVLIDGGSASASEILSGALRDHHVATLVGTLSFGKGLVQTIIPLDDGSAVSITEAKYLTPNGHDVNKEHIRPDIVVQPSDDPNNDVQLKKALQVVKAKIEGGGTEAVKGEKHQAKS